LDLTGQNPYSRLNLTEFKTLDGVKRSLVSRLRLSPEYRSLTPAELALKQQSSSSTITSSAYDSIPLLPQVAVGVKGNKKLKSKILVATQPSGPLGPRRENQNNSPATTNISNAKASGSQQPKKLPIVLTEVSSEDCSPSHPVTTSSVAGTSSGYEPMLDKSSKILPKSSLAKVMKKKSFPKFTHKKTGGNKKVKKGKKKKTNDDSNSNNKEQTNTATASSSTI
jgi:hypothetical protein